MQDRSASLITRRHVLVWTGAALACTGCLPALAAGAEEIEPQPYFAGVKRALEALATLGAPIAPADAERLAALASQNDSAAVRAAEDILSRYTLVRLELQPDAVAHISAGGAQPTLIEQGWRIFLLRVANPSGTTQRLQFGSGILRPISSPSTGASRAAVLDTVTAGPDIERAWLAGEVFELPPLQPNLSGFEVEYRVIQLYSRDHGHRDAHVYFFVTKDPLAGYRAYLKRSRVEFDCLPSRDVLLSVRDVDGRGCMASVTIKDKRDRVYPLQAMRLAPDMYFQPQVYRGDGETVRLPNGEYTVESQRGPEYLRGVQQIIVDDTRTAIEIRLQRWIDPAQWGWYSGDTHIHAAGCAHYEQPTEGVSPETIIRHVRGEGLSIADVLSWGPSWYYQKQFFTGHAITPAATLEHPELQRADNATWQPHVTAEDRQSQLRYDVEVSGFPSSHCGHLVLLRLKEQDYPDATVIQDWPSWNLPILRWAKAQGAVAGYGHCGWGMDVDSTDLPNYEIPPMDGIGTQEGIIDVTHGAVDFLSGCDGLPVAELNAWYHLLNCGFRLAMVGETDFPCATGERVGVGRSYVRLDHRPASDEGYEAWIRAMKQGRLYHGDGRSHFLEFKVNGRRSGDDDLRLKASAEVTVEALVAARLESEVPKDLGPRVEHGNHGVGWHLEWARIGKNREVPVELIVNGVAVDRATLLADGTPRSFRFKTPIARSSWIALRILPSSHAHPVFVRVADQPIRASKRSAQWCRACVDKVWEVKSPFMRESERPAAAEAFDHARKTYDQIIDECKVV